MEGNNAFCIRKGWIQYAKFHCCGTTTSVARGGGGGGGAPPPNNAFSEFCRYIWKFVAVHLEICWYVLADKHIICTDKISFVPTKYWKNSTFSM